jgi:diguanylate cyclase (GGDEF)-like protein
MALAVPPVLSGSPGLLNLLQRTAPLQERAVDIYRRLLAVNELSAAMNTAKDIEQLQEIFSLACQKWMPGDSIRLCIIDGNHYRRSRLSGPAIFSDEGAFPLNHGIVGAVLHSGAPLWIQDTSSTEDPSDPGFDESASDQRSLIILPIIVMGRLIGALDMVSPCPRRFDEFDYHLAILVTAHLSSSLENVITRQELATANARLRDHDVRLTQLNQQLHRLANTDDLTGLFNKRRLFEQLKSEIARTRRYGQILSCMMVDIDNFKRINDSLGHQAGDEILRQMGAVLRRSLRATDFIARYGGEEFTVLLPQTDSTGAMKAAEHLCSQVRSHGFVLGDDVHRFTVSIGMAVCTKFDGLDADQVIVLADNALYNAKRAGKDRACFIQSSVHSFK